MKTVVVFLTFVICALALPHHHDGTDHEESDKHKKFREYHNKCVEETGIDREISKKLVDGDLSSGKDEKTQCFVKCFFQKAGLMSSEGEAQKDALLKKLKLHKIDAEEAEKLAEKCIAVKGESLCETAFKIYECYRGRVEYTHKFEDEEDKKEEKSVEKKADKTEEKTEEKKEEKREEKLEEKTEEKKTEEKKVEKTEEAPVEKNEKLETKKPEEAEEKKVEKPEEKLTEKKTEEKKEE